MLEVVPWRQGYAHTWALRWLLTNAPYADRVLQALRLPGAAPHRVIGEVRTEHRIPGARPDLAFDAHDADGRSITAFIETKVNDKLSHTQLTTMCKQADHVVLYVPGLTGVLMWCGGPAASEMWLTGRDLVDALSGLQLPPIVGPYVEAVGAEADRIDAWRSCARGESAATPAANPLLRVRDGEVESYAWIAEVAVELERRGYTEFWPREQPRDIGLYVQEARTTRSDRNGADVYVEVLVDRHERYVVAVKSGSGDVASRHAFLDDALRLGCPGEHWAPGRRLSKRSMRLWSVDAGEMSASDAADAVDVARAYVTRLGQR
ncbi:MAG: hypothetical protein H0T43_04295 [Solirubrobacterales bacterium]|nr:hypothetical protein [Solirubrobacterales bacterium]